MGDYTVKYPGEKSKAVLQKQRTYVVHDPYPFVIDLAESNGMYLATIDGDKIFDWAGQFGSHLLGYNHKELQSPEYIKRLTVAAANKLANPDFLSLECHNFYAALMEISPKCMKGEGLEVYAVNSGAEAVENAVKYAVKIHEERLIAAGREAPKRPKVIYFEEGYHGRNIYTLAVTDISHDDNIDDFNHMVDRQLKVSFPFDDVDASEEENMSRISKSLDEIRMMYKLYGDQVAVILVEPLQGAGGNRVARKEFWQELSKICNESSIHLVFDEVQTAGGQCGDMFAADLFDLPFPPTAIATAKKFGSGVVYMKRPMKAMDILDSTWGGTLADHVRFTEELRVIKDLKLIEQVARKTEILLSGLRESHGSKKIRSIRGIGLYQGFSTDYKAEIFNRALNEEDLLLLGAGPVSFRFRPTLDVEDAEIELMLQKLDNVLKKIGEH